VKSATLDGEGVICDHRGVTDFDQLRIALVGRGGSRAVFLYAFDLLELNGTNLRPQPWIGCREAPATLLGKSGDGIAPSDHVVGLDRPAVYTAAYGMGLEASSRWSGSRAQIRSFRSRESAGATCGFCRFR
jgi:hypothetical protein